MKRITLLEEAVLEDFGNGVQGNAVSRFAKCTADDRGPESLNR